MENTEKETNNHPKPSEEVQMDIETVTPDTENIVPPTVQTDENIAPKQTEEPTAPKQAEEPSQPAPVAQPEETKAQDETGDTNTGTPEEKENQNNTEGNQKGENDARDAVETVSP